MKYNFTVHPDSELDSPEGKKVIATVSLQVDNPRYKEAYDEEVESEVPIMLENGEFDRDENGEPKTETVTQTVHHRAFSSPLKNFVQDIFIPAEESKQDAAVKKYCEQYEKDYAALFADKD